jgi:hypothetical protein
MGYTKYPNIKAIKIKILFQEFIVLMILIYIKNSKTQEKENLIWTFLRAKKNQKISLFMEDH